MKLTTEQQLALILGLVGQGVEAFATLQRVSATIQQRNAEGRDVTMDDLRGSVERSDASIETLESVIAGMK